MSLITDSTLRVVLYDGSNSQPLENAEVFSALTALLEKGFAVTRAVAGETVGVRERGFTFVFGRFGEKPLSPGFVVEGALVRIQDIMGFDATRIAECAEVTRAETSSAKHGEWKPWFPVID